MMMNHCARDFVVCPKPQRCKAKTDILDIILSKSGCGHDSEQIYSWLPGSPPSRVSNPLIQDARFVEVKRETCLTPILTDRQHTTFLTLVSTSLSSRKGGLKRSNFGNNPTVRVEGFEALDRDSHNCGLYSFA